MPQLHPVDFKNRIALITGGASGIGLAIAQALAAEGTTIVLADIDATQLDAAAGSFPSPVTTAVLDVRDRNAWQALRERVESTLGPVDILINNAGIAPDGKFLADMEPDSFDRIIAINLTGVFNGVSTFAAGMRERGRGHIVNTASTQGLVTCQGLGGYAASKFGVVALSDTLRDELDPFGVGVSVLCPGFVTSRLGESTRKVCNLPPVPIPDMPGLAAADVAQMVLDGIRTNQRYILTHGEYRQPVQERFALLQEAFDKTPVSPLYQEGHPLHGTPAWAAMIAKLRRQ